VFVVDDELGVVGGLQHKAFIRNYEVLPYAFVFESCLRRGVYEAHVAEETLEAHPEVQVVLLDLKFGDGDDLLGLEILRAFTKRHPYLPVLIMSSLDRDVDLLGRCLEDGAAGFVEKHRGPEHLQMAIENVLGTGGIHAVLGQSSPLRRLRREVARLSPYDQIPVMICGERGTGKELIARQIHNNGPRSHGAFVAVNCASVPDSLFESEFFGVEKGAYTGAATAREGYLGRANGGTLFLDEVGCLSVTLQAKLLRVLQEKSFRKLGCSSDERQSSFQLVSATNADPEELVVNGEFRPDFLDRIAAVKVLTPPLRECRSDIPLLARHFLSRLVGDQKSLSPDVILALQRHRWPGNVRELQRVVQECAVRSENHEHVLPSHLPTSFLSVDTGRDVSSTPGAVVPRDWHHERMFAELKIAVEVKRHVMQYKGDRWKAEFMRVLYPHCRASNAKGFSDLIRRLSKGPWGDPAISRDKELSRLLTELEE